MLGDMCTSYACNQVTAHALTAQKKEPGRAALRDTWPVPLGFKCSRLNPPMTGEAELQAAYWQTQALAVV